MSDKPFVRRMLVGILVAVFVVAFIALLIPAFVSTDFMRAAIEKRITAATGQRVELGSTTDVTLLPRPAARLNDIVIRTAINGGEQEAEVVARMRAIDLELSFASLFSDEPSISSAHLVRPEFFVDLDAEAGMMAVLPLRNVNQAIAFAERQNAEQNAQSGEDGDQNQASAALLKFPAWINQSVGTVTFDDGSIEISRASTQGDFPVTLTELTGRLTWPELNAPLSVDATFTLRTEPIKLRLSSRQPVRALAGDNSPISLSIESGLGNLTFEGSSGYTAGFYATGQIGMDTPSLRRLLLWRGTATRPALAIGALSLQAQLRNRGGSLRLDDLELDIEGNRGTGVLEVTDVGEGPVAIIGTLDFESLNMREVLSAFVALPSRPDSNLEIDTRFMDQIQTDLRISAANANFGAISAQNVAATAQTSSNIALFDIGDASAFGGSMQARLRLDRSGERPRAEMMLAGQDVGIADAGLAFGAPPLLPSGTGTFSVTVASPLQTWNDLLSNGSGQVNMRMGSGTLPGLDPSHLQAYSAETGFQPIETDDTNIAAFDRLNWEADIADGEISLNGLNVTYPDSALTFGGFIQMSGGSIAVSATARGNDGGAANSKSFLIGGGLQAPYIFPTLRPQSLQ